jgi:hypothetical protein
MSGFVSTKGLFIVDLKDASSSFMLLDNTFRQISALTHSNVLSLTGPGKVTISDNSFR